MICGVLRRQDRVEVKNEQLRRLRNAENVAVLEKDTGQAGKALVVDHRFTNPTQSAGLTLETS